MASAPTIALEPGSTNTAAVKQLQDYLVSNGYLTQAQVNTGYGTYGPQTTAAVAKLQVDKGVDNSTGVGYFGPRTIAALAGSAAPSPTTTTGTGGGGTSTVSSGGTGGSTAGASYKDPGGGGVYYTDNGNGTYTYHDALGRTIDGVLYSALPAAVKSSIPSQTASTPVSNNNDAPGASSAPPGIDTNYYMKAGESMEAYNSRIAAYNATKNSAPTVPTTNTPINIGALSSSGNSSLDAILKTSVQNKTIDSTTAGLLALINSNTEGQKQYNDTASALTTAMEALGGKGADLKEAENAQGIPEAVTHLNQLNLQAAQLQGELQSLDAETAQGMSNIEGQQIPLGLIQGQQAAFMKQRDLTKLAKSAELASVSGMIQAYQGNIQLGMQLAQQSVDMKYQPIEAHIETLKTQLALASDALESADKKKMTVISALLNAQSTALAAQKANDTSIQTMAIQAAANGAPPAVVNAMKMATDPVSAAQAGGAYIRGTLESLPKTTTTGGGGSGGSGGSPTSFSTTQINNGAQNANVDATTFKKLPYNVQNFYVSAPQANINAVNDVVTQVANGSQSATNANAWVDKLGVPDDVKAQFKQRIAAAGGHAPSAPAASSSNIFAIPGQIGASVANAIGGAASNAFNFLKGIVGL